MVKVSQFKRITSWLKLFTYISATVLLVVNNGPDKLTWLIPLVLLLFFTSYSREFYLTARGKPMSYILAGIVLEMLLILCIGFFDESSVNILFFFICLSSTIISYTFAYSIPLIAVYIASVFLIYTQRYGFDNLARSAITMLFNYGASTAFVIVMSYLVRMQIREKEKLAHMNAELEQAYKKLIDKSAASEKLTVEQERTRMAREIHDTLAHTLTTLIVQLEACRKLASMDPGRLPAELEKAQELSRSGFNEVKRTIKALRPQVMENKSFFTSILSIINDTMENANVHITLNNSLPDDVKLTSSIEIALFRAIQESITNSIRHGQADEIEISIKSDSGMLQLYIEDNGAGCANIKKGYGMQGIKERIESLDGSVGYSSSSGNGFKTTISIPCEVV